MAAGGFAADPSQISFQGKYIQIAFKRLVWIWLVDSIAAQSYLPTTAIPKDPFKRQ